MLENLVEIMNYWGVVWQDEGVFIQPGGIWTWSQKTSVFVTWTGAYCDIFCNKFHGACNLKYILCWNWIGKKKNKKKPKWKKKIKKNIWNNWELSFHCSFEILIHFKPMIWPHFIETARLVFVEPTWNRHPYLRSVIFTVGKRDCCQVLRNKYYY